MNDQTPQTVLADVPIREIHEELLRREAPEVVYLAPGHKINIAGPVWVIINRD